MLPSIARGLNSDSGQLYERPCSDQAQIAIRLAQSWWFARELDNHPVTEHARESKLKLDRIALAQHYGIPTGYLDLTDDFMTSAFFATCKETPKGWEPVREGIGIIYRVDLEGLSNPFGEYKPLGPQSLPRPTDQCAWVSEIPITHSFDGWPNVFIMSFQHDHSVGEYFLNKFEGGEKLFPFDPLADVAHEIVNCGEVPDILLDGAIRSFSEDEYGIKPEQIPTVKKEAMKLTSACDYRRILSQEQVDSLMNDFEWRKKMLSEIKVRWRAVRCEPRLKVDNE